MEPVFQEVSEQRPQNAAGVFAGCVGELKEQVSHLMRVNEYLENESTYYKSLVQKMQSLEDKPVDYGTLSYKYGRGLAQDIQRLAEQNRALKASLGCSMRDAARYENNFNNLMEDVEALDQKNFRKALGSNISNVKRNAIAYAEDIIPTTSQTLTLSTNQYLPGNESSKGIICTCSLKLKDLYDIVDRKLRDYESYTWEDRLGKLRSERDELIYRNSMLFNSLVSAQQLLNNTPGGFPIKAFNASSFNQQNIVKNLKEAYAKLFSLEEINASLEARLEHELTISRSWQTNLRALQRELRDHFSDLGRAAEATGPGCMLFRGSMVEGIHRPQQPPCSVTLAEKESLILLQQARNRIEADSKRIEVHTTRIKDLEAEVASLRLNRRVTRGSGLNTKDRALDALQSINRLLATAEIFLQDKIIASKLKKSSIPSAYPSVPPISNVVDKQGSKLYIQQSLQSLLMKETPAINELSNFGYNMKVCRKRSMIISAVERVQLLLLLKKGSAPEETKKRSNFSDFYKNKHGATASSLSWKELGSPKLHQSARNKINEPPTSVNESNVSRLAATGELPDPQNELLESLRDKIRANMKYQLEKDARGNKPEFLAHAELPQNKISGHSKLDPITPPADDSVTSSDFSISVETPNKNIKQHIPGFEESVDSRNREVIEGVGIAQPEKRATNQEGRIKLSSHEKVSEIGRAATAESPSGSSADAGMFWAAPLIQKELKGESELSGISSLLSPAVKIPEKLTEAIPEKIPKKIAEKIPEKIAEKIPEKKVPLEKLPHLPDEQTDSIAKSKYQLPDFRASTIAVDSSEKLKDAESSEKATLVAPAPTAENYTITAKEAFDDSAAFIAIKSHIQELPIHTLSTVEPLLPPKDLRHTDNAHPKKEHKLGPEKRDIMHSASSKVEFNIANFKALLQKDKALNESPLAAHGLENVDGTVLAPKADAKKTHFKLENEEESKAVIAVLPANEEVKSFPLIGKLIDISSVSHDARDTENQLQGMPSPSLQPMKQAEISEASGDANTYESQNEDSSIFCKTQAVQNIATCDISNEQSADAVTPQTADDTSSKYPMNAPYPMSQKAPLSSNPPENKDEVPDMLDLEISKSVENIGVESLPLRMQDLKETFKKHLTKEQISLAEAYRKMVGTRTEAGGVSAEIFQEFAHNLSIDLSHKDVDRLFLYICGGGAQSFTMIDLYTFFEEADVKTELELGARLTEMYLSVRDALKHVNLTDDEKYVTEDDFTRLCQIGAVNQECTQRLFSTIKSNEGVTVRLLRDSLNGLARPKKTGAAGTFFGAIKAVKHLSALSRHNRHTKLRLSNAKEDASRIGSPEAAENIVTPEQLSSLISTLSMPTDMRNNLDRLNADDGNQSTSILRGQLNSSVDNFFTDGLGMISPFTHLAFGDSLTTLGTASSIDDFSDTDYEGSVAESFETDEKFKPSNISKAQLLHNRIIDKYGSCAGAFKFMDENGNGNVTIHEFANFMEESGFEYGFDELYELYVELCRPVSNLLTVSCLYRNLEGEDCSLVQLNKRLEEIHGNPAHAFLELKNGGSKNISSEEFTVIAGRAGVGSAHSLSLWKQIDSQNKETLLLTNLLSLLEGSATIDEIRAVEAQASSLNTIFLQAFTGESSGKTLSLKKSDTLDMQKLAPVKPEIKKSWGLQEEHIIFDDLLEATLPWDCLQFQDRSNLIQSLKRVVYQPGKTIYTANSSDTRLLFLVAGEISFVRPGFFYESVEGKKQAPCILLSESIVEENVCELTILASDTRQSTGKAEACVIWELEKSVYVKNYKKILKSRIQEVEEYLIMIAKVPIIHKLSSPEKRRLASSFKKMSFGKSQAIIREFDEPDAFYLVKSGKAAVVKNFKSDEDYDEFRVYQVADYFGEVSLITNKTRTATIIAKVACECLCLDKDTFQRLLGNFKNEFMIRAQQLYTTNDHFGSSAKSVKKEASGASSSESKKEAKNSSTASRRNAKAAINADTNEESPAFQLIRMEKKIELDELFLVLEVVPIIKELSPEQRKALVRDLVLEIHYPNAPIVIEGDYPDKFYILKSGTVSVMLYQGPGKPLRALKEYSSAEYFGEMSLIKDQQRSAYIIATTPVHVYSLEKQKFLKHLEHRFSDFLERAKTTYHRIDDISIVQQSSSLELTGTSEDLAEIKQKCQLLSSNNLLAKLQQKQLIRLAQEATIVTYWSREVLFEEGMMISRLYLICEGSVAVQIRRDLNQARDEIEVLEEGALIGVAELVARVRIRNSFVAKSAVSLITIALDDLKVEIPDLRGFFSKELKNVDISALQQLLAPPLLLPQLSKLTSNENLTITLPITPNDVDFPQLSPQDSDIPLAETDDSVSRFNWVVDEEKASYERKKDDRRQSESSSLGINLPEILVATSPQTTDADEYEKNSNTLLDTEGDAIISPEEEVESSYVRTPSNELPPEESPQLLKKKKRIYKALISRYGTLANAYNSANTGNPAQMEFKEFHTLLKGLELKQAIKKDTAKKLFNSLGGSKNCITMADFYHITPQDTSLDVELLSLRLKEIYGGSPQKAFSSVCSSTDPESSCTKEEFLRLAEIAACSRTDALKIWSDLDEHSVGSIRIKEILQKMEGEMPPVQEPQTGLMGQFIQILGIQESRDVEKKSEAVDFQTEDSVKIDLKYEDLIIVRRDDHKNHASECELLQEQIKEMSERFSNLSHEQRSYVISLMRREAWLPGKSPVQQGSRKTGIYYLIAGSADLIQAGFLGFESTIRTLKVLECAFKDEVLDGRPAECSLIVRGNNEAIFWVLSVDSYTDLILPMLNEREVNVRKILCLLDRIPALQDSSAAEKSKLSKAFQIESYKIYQKIVKAGNPFGRFCIIYSGEASTQPREGSDTDYSRKLKRGDCFGELFTSYGGVAQETILADTDVVVLTLANKDSQLVPASAARFFGTSVASVDANSVLQQTPDEALAKANEAWKIKSSKKTRKSSLALTTYTKLSKGHSGKSKGVEQSITTSVEEEPHWVKYNDPTVTFEPPSPLEKPGSSCMRSPADKRRKKLFSVTFSEDV